MISRRRFLRAVPGAALAVGTALRARAAARRVDLLCRRAWGALKPTGEFERHRIRRLTVHHSAVVLSDNRDAPAHIRSHQRSHQARGWPDIAYHLVIDRNGNVYEGRPMWAVPDTATNYDPTGHFTVMCEGNFQEQRPSRAQVDALVDVLAWASTRFEVAPRTIAGTGTTPTPPVPVPRCSGSSTAGRSAGASRSGWRRATCEWSSCAGPRASSASRTSRPAGPEPQLPGLMTACVCVT